MPHQIRHRRSPRPHRRIASGVAVAAAVACSTAACTPGSGGSAPTTTVPASGVVSVLVTTGDRTKLLSVEPSLTLTPTDPVNTPTITVDPGTQFQTMDGVGAALTDSSATLLNALPSAQRSGLIADLFGPNGARLSEVRVPLSSSDFSTSDYTTDDVPLTQTDPTLSQFSLAHDDATVVPLLQQAKTVNPALRLMGTPWSAPGWMKTGNDTTTRKGLIGGTLAATNTTAYGRLLARIAAEYAARGLPLDVLTLQNEPGFSPADYPGMTLSASQEAQLAVAAGQALAADGMATKVVVHDHNWDLSARALDVLADPTAAPYIAGSAYHCYGGDPSAQTTVHDAFPTKDIYFTECTGTFSSGNFASNLLWNTNVLLIGATRNWAKTVLLWNLALDETSGPHNGGCGDCRGVVTINSSTGAVTKNEEYYALAQFGRGVDVGAVRIQSTSAAVSVRSVAFQNPDGSRSLLVSNSGTTATDGLVQDGDQSFHYQLPPRSVTTYRWK